MWDNAKKWDAPTIYREIVYDKCTYNVQHVVNMVNNNKKYHKDWFEKVLLHALINNKIPYDPWIIKSLINPEYKRRVIEAVCLKQLGGENE